MKGEMIDCPFCGKTYKTQEHTIVSTCTHCFKSFRKKGMVPMKHDLSGPLEVVHIEKEAKNEA